MSVDLTRMQAHDDTDFFVLLYILHYLVSNTVFALWWCFKKYLFQERIVVSESADTYDTGYSLKVRLGHTFSVSLLPTANTGHIGGIQKVVGEWIFGYDSELFQ